jgi:hypothetical protein
MPKQHQFAFKEEAEVEKQRWRETAPAIESAYQPSGKLPQGAMQWMTGGVVLGIPAGAVAGAVVAAVGIAISLLLASLLKEMSSGGGRGIIMLGIATFGAALGTFIGMYVLLGFTASHVVVATGKRGKNRNPAAAAVLAVVAALGATLVFRAIMAEAPGMVEKRDAVEALTAVFGPGEFAVLCLIVGAAGAALTAGIHARKAVRKTKFCETCEVYVDTIPPRPISFAGATEALKTVAAGDTAAAAAALTAVAAEEQEGSLNLYRCPRCGAGYAELQVSFSAKWPKKGKPTESEAMSESWQVCSKACSLAEMTVLAGPAEAATAPGA